MPNKKISADEENLSWLRTEFSDHLFIDHIILYIAAKEINATSMADHAFDDLKAMFGIDPAFRNRNVFNAAYWHVQIIRKAVECDQLMKDNTRQVYEAGVHEILSDGKPVDVYTVLRDYQENFIRKLGMSKDKVSAGERGLYQLLRESYKELS